MVLSRYKHTLSHTLKLLTKQLGNPSKFNVNGSGYKESVIINDSSEFSQPGGDNCSLGTLPHVSTGPFPFTLLAFLAFCLGLLNRVRWMIWDV